MILKEQRFIDFINVRRKQSFLSKCVPNLEIGNEQQNHFNPRTIKYYELRIRNFVMLKVYDIAGREVATFVNDFMPAGKHAVEFNARLAPSYFQISN